MIIRGGRNQHPDELEAAAGRLDGLEHAGVAAFGCPDPAQGIERLIVVAETRWQDTRARAELRRAITALPGGCYGWPAVLATRDQARAAGLALSAEPDLG
jgi:acyl-CoA synthetase (AMP-forming)/AMP-acid ligase II